MDEWNDEYRKDTTLQKVLNYVVNGWPNKNELEEDVKPYWEVRSEISEDKGMLLRGEKEMKTPGMQMTCSGSREKYCG
ncbi:hypothetical protein NDU88_003706 [Pleurodeles waltl]|uniref:Uncharacterized protein n=1 Tax=Pleurodeles waltl TaxID=8319 RepID=A0AAV7VGQ7_PLEWA|nr:hypothetical protein NDU88_003706 [Pleurodeles waltl]